MGANAVTEKQAAGLATSLSALHLWGIAVGLAISGEYFGWSYGGAHSGTQGFTLLAGAWIFFRYRRVASTGGERFAACCHAAWCGFSVKRHVQARRGRRGISAATCRTSDKKRG